MVEVEYMSKVLWLKNNWLFIFLFFLALSLRIIYFDTELELFSDENVYHYAGVNLAEYNVLTNDRDGAMSRGEVEITASSTIQPGYPLLIAGIYKFFGENEKLIRYFNIIISMMMFCLVYLVSKEIKLKKLYIALVLLLVAVYPGFNFNTAKILSEHLFTVLLMLHIYYFIRFLNNEKVKNLVLASLFIALSIFVRAHGFPIMIISMLFIVIFHYGKMKYLAKKILITIGIFIIVQFPWWLRNYIQFDKFILFSDAGDNPKIWGALPYFIGIFEVGNKTLTELLFTSIDANSSLFYEWRIFGFFQYMWGDVWDEYLVHPFQGLRPFLILQYIVIVPTVILLPLILNKCNKNVLYLSTIPILFTIMNLPYHGLPRYVWPSIAVVTIIFGYMVQYIIGIFLKKGMGIQEQRLIINYRKSLLENIFRWAYIVFGVIFSIILFYSVYVFSFKIETEMSQYRIERYTNIKFEEVTEQPNLYTGIFDNTTDNLTIENAEILNQGSLNRYKNVVTDPTIIRVNEIPLTKDNVISKIHIRSNGGYIFDYMTIYWTTNKEKEISESRVFRFPINPLEESQTIFVDGDITNLMIVPINFRGGKFTFEHIEIKKFDITENNN